MSGLVGCLLLLGGLPGFLGRAILLSIIYWVRKVHGLQSCAHSRGPGVSTIPTALLTPEDPIQPKRLLLSTSITVGIHTPQHTNLQCTAQEKKNKHAARPMCPNTQSSIQVAQDGATATVIILDGRLSSRLASQIHST